MIQRPNLRIDVFRYIFVLPSSDESAWNQVATTRYCYIQALDDLNRLHSFCLHCHIISRDSVSRYQTGRQHWDGQQSQTANIHKGRIFVIVCDNMIEVEAALRVKNTPQKIIIFSLYFTCYLTPLQVSARTLRWSPGEAYPTSLLSMRPTLSEISKPVL